MILTRQQLRIGNTWLWMTQCFNVGLMSGGRSRGTNSFLIRWLKFIVAIFKITWTTLYKNFLFKIYLNRKKWTIILFPSGCDLGGMWFIVNTDSNEGREKEVQSISEDHKLISFITVPKIVILNVFICTIMMSLHYEERDGIRWMHN